MKKSGVVLKTVFGWMVIALTAVQGCRYDDPDRLGEFREVNKWILDNMNFWYFWNTQIPRRTDQSLYPKDYFASLLDKKEDKFSWIQEDYTELMKYLQGVNTEAGYEFELFYVAQGSNLVKGCITYVKPGTPAKVAGLKRGDWFTSINDVIITEDNYLQLIRQMSQTHIVGKVDANTGQTAYITLTAIEYKENPILLDTIYNMEHKKIGYFVYNLFARDSKDYGIAYERELNDLFGKFQNQAIDELIIDLRYNSGGAVATTEALASMISNRSATDILGYELYNSILDGELTKLYGKDHNIAYFPDYILQYNSSREVVDRVKINKLPNLERVYMLVTRHSASASELLVNWLKPYMEVVLVGETTYGKNVGSITIYETDKEKQKTNKWGMQPIVSKFENSLHFSDYANGFAPDIESNEFGGADELLELGDIDELMLSDALNHIFGKTSLRKENVALKLKNVGSSFERNPTRTNMYVDLKLIAY